MWEESKEIKALLGIRFEIELTRKWFEVVFACRLGMNAECHLARGCEHEDLQSPPLQNSSQVGCLFLLGGSCH